jgi:hypothetical protein
MREGRVVALARFVSSDVYVFYNAEGGITCMLCQFMPTTEVHHEKGSPFEGLNGTMSILITTPTHELK